MPRRCLILMIALLTAWCGQGELRADVLVMTSGGRLQGELLNPSESPREKYVFRSEIGGQVTLDAALVERVIVLTDAEKAYKSALSRMNDTVEDHEKLAEWCRERNLLTERTFHLEQIIRLDPDHEEARKTLGFSKIDGKWMTQLDRMAAIGLTKHGSSWRPVQVIEMEHRRRQRELAELDLRKKVKMWRSWIGKRRQEEAIANLRGLRTSLASTGLIELMKNEQYDQLRQLYVEVLGKIGGRSAISTLIKYATEDPSTLVRDACLDALEQNGRNSAVLSFTAQLASKDNQKVNRAAQGLARMNDPSAIPALIDALVTRHKYIINAGQPGIGASFSNQGGAGLSQGGGPKLIERDLQNGTVLGALLALTGGANFQYDEERWKRWYAETNTPQHVDLRRGD